ncbi:MAG: hypothetical protein U9P88_02610 [Patescibacteria group bacterium]|nr:hypothetical protein [Patescibacteria group bacterium]
MDRGQETMDRGQIKKQRSVLCKLVIISLGETRSPMGESGSPLIIYL